MLHTYLIQLQYSFTIAYDKLLKHHKPHMSPFVACRLLRPTSNIHASSRCLNRLCSLMRTKPYIYIYIYTYTIYTSPTLSRIPHFNCNLLLSRHPSTTNVLCTQRSASSLLTSELSTQVSRTCCDRTNVT
jgi:hypothetical protein